MRISAPTTWGDEVLDLIRNYPVFSVYGALETDGLAECGPLRSGLAAASSCAASPTPKPSSTRSNHASGDSGTASLRTPRIDFSRTLLERDRLAGHVAKVREAGSSFTYLLNASCMGNREFSDEGRSAIVELLGFLSEIGVEYVSVALPQLVDIVRRHAPSIRVRVSTIAFVDSPQRARFFEELGAHEITLDFNINRDFQRLRAIREAVSLELGVIVNDFCLLRCPWAMSHYNAIAHASQGEDRAPFVDSYILSCKSRQIERPVEMLRAPWIRPEDVERYERLGIDNFKVSGRGMDAEFMRRVVQAYAERRWDGNLMALFETVTRKAEGLEGPSVQAFHAIARAMERTTIENRALDGFLERFEKISCGDCERCDWCGQWAERAVRIDGDARAEALALCAAALDRAP